MKKILYAGVFIDFFVQIDFVQIYFKVAQYKLIPSGNYAE